MKKIIKIFLKFGLIYFVIWLILNLIWPRHLNIGCEVFEKTGVNKETIVQIPKEKLFYYYYGHKIGLARNVSRCSVFFTVNKWRRSEKMFVDNRIGMEFVDGVPKEKIDEMYAEAGLIKETKDYGNIILYTGLIGPESKFDNSIEMAQFLEENYDIVKYASPNFLYVGSGFDFGLGRPISMVELIWNTYQTIRDRLGLETESSRYSQMDETDGETERYVENLGVIKEDSEHKYIDGWKEVYGFEPRTLVEYVNMFVKNKDVSDLSLVSFSLEETDVEGKSEIVEILFYSGQENKMWRFTSNYGQVSESVEEVKNNDFKTVLVANLIDSKELIRMAQKNKGGCKDGVHSIAYFGSLGYTSASITCHSSKWEELIPIL